MMNTGAPTSGATGTAGESSSLVSSFEDEINFNNEVQRYIIESGEYEKFIEILRSKLSRTSWNDRVNKYCRDLLMQVGVDNITFDEIFEKVLPIAQNMVPDNVREEMLNVIQESLEKKYNTR